LLDKFDNETPLVCSPFFFFSWIIVCGVWFVILLKCFMLKKWYLLGSFYWWGLWIMNMRETVNFSLRIETKNWKSKERLLDWDICHLMPSNCWLPSIYDSWNFIFVWQFHVLLKAYPNYPFWKIDTHFLKILQLD
jgi:hypothetical protein